MEIHKIKIQDRFLQAIKSGEKTFEIRKNDRDYKVGDFLVFLTEDGAYTGEAKAINYITDFEQKKGYVVMGITSNATTRNTNPVSILLGGGVLICPQFSTEYKIIDKKKQTVLMREKGQKWQECSIFCRSKYYLITENGL